MRRKTWVSLSWSRLVWIARRLVPSDSSASYDSLVGGVIMHRAIMVQLYKRRNSKIFLKLFLQTRIPGISLIGIWFSFSMTVMFCSFCHIAVQLAHTAGWLENLQSKNVSQCGWHFPRDIPWLDQLHVVV